MRRLFYLIGLLLLSASFGLETNLDSYNKGENIRVILNDLIIGDSYLIKGLNDNNLVFNHEFIASSDSYVYNYPINFLDPSGVYVINANNESKNVLVNPTRDSSSYLVSFISPLSKSYERTIDFPIEVNVTMAGEAVTDAIVQSFSDSGERINLSEKGNGVYSAPYSLLINSGLGVKSLRVLVTKAGLGGEGVINITVTSARISINLIQPELNSYDIGSMLSIRFNALYPNGSIITSGVSASYGESSLALELINDYYVSTYSLKPSDDGLVTLSINALDSYGNTGSFSKKITRTGLINYYLISNIYYIIAGIIGLIVIFYFSKKKVKTSLGTKSLKEKQSELLDKKKKLQNEYYVTGSINKKAFDEEIGNIDEELSIIKEKLKK